MTKPYLNLAKPMFLLLAIAAPLTLYQSYRNYRDLVLSNADFRASLSSERDLMAHQIAHNFFSQPNQLEFQTMKRILPDGAIEGLKDFPETEFQSILAAATQSTQTVPNPLLALLFSEDRFPSGTPKRYAGMLEILSLNPTEMKRETQGRLLQVAADFWVGRELQPENFAFLLSKLPAILVPLFAHQRTFAGLEQTPGDGRFEVSLVVDDTQYHLAVPRGKLAELNRLTKALNQDTVFELGSRWADWGKIRFTLNARHTPMAGRLWKTSIVYAGMGIGIELVILLLYGIMMKYEKINRAQKQLLATTSHELRTPLAVMRQFSELLLSKRDRFDEKFVTYHAYIHRECLKMQFLVENLLSAAKFEYLKLQLNPEPFALKPWLEELAESVAQLSEPHPIRVDCPEVDVTWDRGLMGQVLVNLLENARIHAGTEIDVRVIVNGPQVRITVRDYGQVTDLDKLKRPKAFKPGLKGKSGLGLGLYLSDRILKAHGGALGFEAADPGLRVILELMAVCKNQ